jgi:hypothetical protein
MFDTLLILLEARSFFFFFCSRDLILNRTNRPPSPSTASLIRTQETTAYQNRILSSDVLSAKIEVIHRGSVADPDPSDLYVFGSPGPGSASQRYGSGSIYHQTKMVRKP